MQAKNSKLQQTNPNIQFPNHPTKTPTMPASTQPSLRKIQQIYQNQQIADEPDHKLEKEKRKKRANWSEGLGLSVPENSWRGEGGRGRGTGRWMVTAPAIESRFSGRRRRRRRGDESDLEFRMGKRRGEGHWLVSFQKRSGRGERMWSVGSRVLGFGPSSSMAEIG